MGRQRHRPHRPGQRLRKVTESQAGPGQTPTRLREHLYLGVLEVYREYAGDSATVTLSARPSTSWTISGVWP